ncbi:MAG TPA: glycosyltransferase, partial [Leptospiraceae bacterium]|nr:glycosyltransferase [Leptospiraceae bacterium]
MIFEDPTARRWRSFLIAFFTFLLVGGGLAAAFVAALFVTPPLPDFQHKRNVDKRVRILRDQAQDLSAKQKHGHEVQRKVEDKKGPLLAIPRQGDKLVTAFLVQHDLASVAAFRDHKDRIDVVFPDWYFLTSAKCEVSERIDEEVRRVLDESDSAVIGRVTNGDHEKWHTAEMRRLLASPQLRECIAGVLVQFAERDHLKGLNIDIETLGTAGRADYVKFLKELADRLHERDMILTVDITAHDPAYDVKAIAQVADGVVLMAYDEHYTSGPAGPIASQEWFEENVAFTLKDVPPEKLIVGIGTYAIDWSQNHSYSMKFSEVMALADDMGALPGMDPESRNMHFSYSEDGNNHTVWFLNNVTAWNQKLAIDRLGVAGIGVWRLGAEDPSIWKILPQQKPNIEAVVEPEALRSVLYLSFGEVFHLHTVPSRGKMSVEQDGEGFIDAAKYDSLPEGYLIERIGNSIPDKSLVLTFDDGPDPVWTPKVLDALKESKVHATFFVVGEQAERYPEIVQRILAEGHAIGNHTYFHPDLSKTSPERVRLELNSTQRIIERETGYKTMLFRAPYNTDSNPDEAPEIDPLRTAADMGYLIIGANIDVADWQKPTARLMADRLIEQAKNPRNHIIVMHDGGGDRSRTVEALRIGIPELKSKGYVFQSLEDATGISKSTLFPAMPASEAMLVYITAASWLSIRWGWVIITWLFLFTTLLAIFRIVFLGILVFKSVRKAEERKDDGTFLPPVSVLIPSYNEAKVLSQTIQSLQQSTHPQFEMLVIDDGSTDNTKEIVRGLMKKDKRIRLVSQPNGGKSSALNLGMKEAKHEIVVTIDADTIVMPQTLTELAAPFKDPLVDAVCGNVEVGNVHNVLTGFQSLEYITSQNFDRRAFDALNCISVVPGATGGWRRSKVLEAGGYKSDTLTEDADLTLTMLENGARIVYAAEARSRTEAPATIRTLSKQRFRWSFGTFQCLWKHRHAFFKGPLGWVALPNMFLFQVLFPALSP